jgi:hypothetical protein
MNDHDAGQFWVEFLGLSATVREHIHARRMRAAFDMVEAVLQAHGYDFAFELTEEKTLSVLVLTPEGDREQAQRIDELLAHRSDVPGWTFYGRRQRKEFKDALTFVRHIHGCDASDVMFHSSESGSGHEITVITQAMEGLSDDAAYGLAATLLDHALGESVVMSQVSAIHPALPASCYEGPVLSFPQLDALLREDERSGPKK